jgi:predicted molibdopterin-dependent oxidoreductase YjgC
LYVEPKGDRVAALCPSANHPVSTGRLCIKGWNLTSSVMGADRLRTPLVRKQGSLEPVSWQEAISFTAEALKRVLSDAGPAGVGVIGSAKTTNEECYSLVKLARGVIGTPNVDGACRFYDASLIPGLLETTRVPASGVDIGSVACAGSLLIVGSGLPEELAHIGSRVEDAARAGCKVVAADPRTSRLAPHVSLFLHPKPGTDLVWLRALLRTIISRRLHVENAPEMPGFEELRNSLADGEMSRLAETCGLDPDVVVEAAEMLGKNPPVVVMFGLGIMQQAGSTRAAQALANVAILLGGSVMPLRGQNNAQGSCDMGLAHDFLPGYDRLADADARTKWESVWDCKMPEEPGMNAVEMIRSCASGELKALMVFGENIALSAPNTEQSLASLDKAQFLAVSDLYLTETARLADVVFPACSFLEKDGTFTNIERRVQRVRKVFEPVGESKSDLETIADLASALGADVSREPAAVMGEIASNVAQYKNVSHQALDEDWGKPWPADGAKERLAPIPSGESKDTGEYPFRLVASRAHYHYQTGTMTARSTVLAREYPEPWAELNESDAEKLGLRPGSIITIKSKSGSMTRRMMLSDAVPRGCVHVPLSFGGDSPNALGDYTCDPASGVPVYKGLAVNVGAAK